MAVSRSHPTMAARVLVALRRVEGRLLILAVTASGALWGFLSMLDTVEDKHTGTFDRLVLLAFRDPGQPDVPIGPRWVRECARDVTALGGFTVLTLITVLAVVILAMKHRRLQAVIFGASVVLGQGLAELVKAIVNRPRPSIVSHLDLVYSSSFPSGHSTMSPVVYLTLAVIVSAGEARRDVRILLFWSAAALVIAIGISRVYLGVHWPSDVVAGWCLGALVALIAMTVLRLTAHKLRRGGAVQAVKSAPPAAATLGGGVNRAP